MERLNRINSWFVGSLAFLSFLFLFLCVIALFIWVGVFWGQQKDDVHELDKKANYLYQKTYGLSCGNKYCNFTQGIFVPGTAWFNGTVVFTDSVYYNAPVAYQNTVLRIEGPDSYLLSDRMVLSQKYQVAAGCVVQGQSVSLARNASNSVIAGHTTYSRYQLLSAADIESVRTAPVDSDTFVEVFRAFDQAWAVCATFTPTGVVYDSPIPISATGYGFDQAELDVEGGFSDGDTFAVAYNDPANFLQGTARLCSCGSGLCGTATVYRVGISTIVSDLLRLDDTHVMVVYSDSADLDAEVLEVTGLLTFSDGTPYTIDGSIANIDERPASLHRLDTQLVVCVVGDGDTTDISTVPIEWDGATGLTVGTPETVLSSYYAPTFHQSTLLSNGQLVITLQSIVVDYYDAIITVKLFANGTQESIGDIAYFRTYVDGAQQIFSYYSEAATVAALPGNDDAFLICSRDQGGALCLVGRLDGNGALREEGFGSIYRVSDSGVGNMHMTTGLGANGNEFAVCFADDVSIYTNLAELSCAAGSRVNDRDLTLTRDNRGPQPLGMAINDGCTGQMVDVVYFGTVFHPGAAFLCDGPSVCSHSDGSVDSSCTPRAIEQDGQVDTPIPLGRCITDNEVFISVGL